jgi:hypothetical protein
MLPGQKGALAEAAVVHAAVKLGISLFKPVFDGERYDLISIFSRPSFACNANGPSSETARSSSAVIRNAAAGAEM